MTIYATEQSNTIDPDDESNRSAEWRVDEEEDVALYTKDTKADYTMTNAQSDNSDSDNVILVGSSDSRPSYLDINDLDAVCGRLLDDVPSSNEEGRGTTTTTSTTRSSSDPSTARKKRGNGRRRKKIDFGPPAAMTENMEPMYAVERIVNHKIYRGRVVQYEIQWAGFSSKENSYENANDIHEDCPEFCAAYWDEHEPRPPNAPGYRGEEGGGDTTSTSRSMTLELSPAPQQRQRPPPNAPCYSEEEEWGDTTTTSRSMTLELSPPLPPRSETFELNDSEGEVDSIYRKRDHVSPYPKDVQPSFSPSPSPISNMSDQITPSIPNHPSTTCDDIPSKKQQESFNDMIDNATAPISPTPTAHLSSLAEKQSPPSHNQTTLKDKSSSRYRSPLGEKLSSLPQDSLSKDKARLQSTPKVTFKTHDKLPDENEIPPPPSPPKTPSTIRNQHHRNYAALLDGITRIPPFFKRQGFIFAKDTDYPTYDTHWNKEVAKLHHIQYIEPKDQLLAYISWKNGYKTVHPVQELHYHCPGILIDFYEEHLQLGFNETNA